MIDTISFAKFSFMFSFLCFRFSFSFFFYEELSRNKLKKKKNIVESEKKRIWTLNRDKISAKTLDVSLIGSLTFILLIAISRIIMWELYCLYIYIVIP